MDEKYLKTTWKQRILYVAIAVLLLGITITTYIAIVLSGNKKSTSSDNSDSSGYESLLQQKSEEISAAAKTLSGSYLDELASLKTFVTGYNAESANSEGLVISDVQEGTGTEITEEWKDYYAYYIGWCANEEVFDSSFDDYSNPTSLNAPLSGAIGLISGWEQGVIGMKVGGVRLLTIPGELAYGEDQEICGGTNSPLKFLILAIEPGEDYRKLMSEYEDIYSKYVSSMSTNE